MLDTLNTDDPAALLDAMDADASLYLDGLPVGEPTVELLAACVTDGTATRPLRTSVTAAMFATGRLRLRGAGRTAQNERYGSGPAPGEAPAVNLLPPLYDDAGVRCLTAWEAAALWGVDQRTVTKNIARGVIDRGPYRRNTAGGSGRAGLLGTLALTSRTLAYTSRWGALPAGVLASPHNVPGPNAEPDAPAL